MYQTVVENGDASVPWQLSGVLECSTVSIFDGLRELVGPLVGTLLNVLH